MREMAFKADEQDKGGDLKCVDRNVDERDGLTASIAGVSLYASTIKTRQETKTDCQMPFASVRPILAWSSFSVFASMS